VGGSLAHADPAADWVNCMAVLGARLHLASASRRRGVGASEFMKSAYQTALEPGEILTAVELPAFSAQMRWGYYKICSKVGEFASAIGAVVVDPALGMTSLLIGAIEARPLLAPTLAGVLSMPQDAARDAVAAHLVAVMPDAGEVFVHQHAVALVRAVPMYGYHPEERPFAKIVL
jgi:carbon-monoxide dehydrogenase medium subunit